jgi:hypothetical protein
VTRVSAQNCNALTSLLYDIDNFATKASSIIRIVQFVSQACEESKFALRDKWNLSPFYPIMLIAKSFTELLSRWQEGRLAQIPDEIINQKVVPTLVKSLQHIVENQGQDGSWGKIGPYEETAYAILALTCFLDLPLPPEVLHRTSIGVRCGREFLSKRGDAPPEFLWIEKTAYGSPFLMNAFALTALYCRSGVSTRQSSEDHSDFIQDTTTLPITLLGECLRRELRGSSILGGISELVKVDAM